MLKKPRTRKDQVRAALFNPRSKPNPLWYHKKEWTINKQLRNEIMGILPDVDKDLADLILRVIFQTISDGVIAGHRVNIRGFGSFFKQWIPRRKSFFKKGPDKWVPGRYRAGFRITHSLKKKIIEAGEQEWNLQNQLSNT